MDPELLKQLLASMQTQPEYTAKGKEKPYSLTEQAKQTNFQQDQLSSLTNPLFAALLGGGSGFDPSVFQPVQDGADSYDVPQDPLAPYHGLPDGSEEKTIATKIAEGQSPEQIVKQFSAIDAYKSGNADDPKALDRVRSLASQLFKDQSNFQHSISSVPGFDPSTGQWSVPEGAQYVGGKLVMPKYKPSDAAMAFEKAGLPTPDKLFTGQDFGGGDFSGVLGQGASAVQDATGAANASHDAWSKLQDQEAQSAGKNLQMKAMLQQAKWSLPTPAAPLTGIARVDHARSPQSLQPTSGMDALLRSPEWLNASMGAHPLDTPDVLGGQDARFARGKDGKPLGAQAVAYDKYSRDVTKQRAAEKQLGQVKRFTDMANTSGDTEAKILSQHGLTPLTMAMLQRSRGLGQING